MICGLDLVKLHGTERGSGTSGEKVVGAAPWG